nr:unnamed protein product [Digitaria exilis]
MGRVGSRGAEFKAVIDSGNDRGCESNDQGPVGSGRAMVKGGVQALEPRKMIFMSGKHEFGVTELVSSPRRISRFSNGLERAEEMEEDQELVEMGMHREDDVVIKEPKGKGVLEEDHTVKRQPYKRNQGFTTPIRLYAVECYTCHKWRTIPTKEEYEEIRENFTEDKWICNKRPDGSCDYPADMEYDRIGTWVVDKPGIPKAPLGTERIEVMRSDFSKMDTYYIMPTGKRVKGPADVEKFLETNPEYKSRMSASEFNFATPKVPGKNAYARRKAAKRTRQAPQEA